METKNEQPGYDDTWKDEFGAIYTIGNNMLFKGVNIPHYVVRDETKIICDHAFDSCDELKEITLPESLSQIGRYAFYNSKSLKSPLSPPLLKYVFLFLIKEKY